MSSILIVPVPPFDMWKVNALVSPVQSTFGLPVHVNSADTVDPSFAFDLYRNQYNSTSIISAFIRQFEKHEGKVLGITSVDFFVPVLTYVFGEAQLDGPIAVVSSYRLDETLYGAGACANSINRADDAPVYADDGFNVQELSHHRAGPAHSSAAPQKL